MLRNLNIGGIPNREGGRYPSGKIWPDGSFSVGWVRDRPDEKLDGRRPELSLPEDDGTSASAARLDLRDVRNSHSFPQCPLEAGSEGTKDRKRPEKYGKKGITGYGRNMVRSVGALIDRFYPHHRVTFCTITMPPVPDRERRDLAQTWPRLVKEIQQNLKRRLQRKGLPQVVLSVTEIQCGRLEKYGEGYLHLHLMWLNPPGRSDNWAVDVLNLKAWVRDFLIRNELCSDDANVNVDTRSVKGEKSNYLAKYVSKGSDEIEEFARDNGWESVPGQWWNVTNEARSWVKTYLVKGRGAGEYLDILINETFDRNQFAHFHYLYHIDIEIDGALLNVGWRGGLTREAWEDAVGSLLELDDVW